MLLLNIDTDSTHFQVSLGAKSKILKKQKSSIADNPWQSPIFLHKGTAPWTRHQQHSWCLKLCQSNHWLHGPVPVRFHPQGPPPSQQTWVQRNLVEVLHGSWHRRFLKLRCRRRIHTFKWSIWYKETYQPDISSRKLTNSWITLTAIKSSPDAWCPTLREAGWVLKEPTPGASWESPALQQQFPWLAHSKDESMMIYDPLQPLEGPDVWTGSSRNCTCSGYLLRVYIPIHEYKPVNGAETHAAKTRKLEQTQEGEHLFDSNEGNTHLAGGNWLHVESKVCPHLHQWIGALMGETSQSLGSLASMVYLNMDGTWMVHGLHMVKHLRKLEAKLERWSSFGTTFRVPQGVLQKVELVLVQWMCLVGGSAVLSTFSVSPFFISLQILWGKDWLCEPGSFQSKALWSSQSLWLPRPLYPRVPSASGRENCWCRRSCTHRCCRFQSQLPNALNKGRTSGPQLIPQHFH